jgi:hypothetical protein
VNGAMTTDPDFVRTRIGELLAELPDIGATGDLGDMEIDDVAQRLEEAHDVLVHALESVEKG